MPLYKRLQIYKNYIVVRTKIFKTIVLIAFIGIIIPVMGQEHGIKTVVIDAGHGGKDPGTHGKLVNEKTVVLAISLKLGNYIKSKYPDIDVIYTRDKDVFVELDQRAKVANKKEADLFISIHANSASPAAYGTETYVLGLHRTKSQEAVAKRENSTIYFEEDNGAKYKGFDLSPDAIIARQIQLSVFLNQSISLASRIQNHFTSIGRHDRGVKQAGFLVLYKTTMPSMLVEVGFLTNPAEEKFLNSEKGQIKMANSIFKAFQEYKAELEGVNVLVENGHGYESSLVEAQTIDDEPVTEEPEAKDVVYFKVQVETSRSKLEANHERFKNINVQEYSENGLYKYTSGVFKNDLEAASKYKNQMRELGFEHAFVVAFMNNKRIPIDQAIRLAKK